MKWLGLVSFFILLSCTAENSAEIIVRKLIDAHRSEILNNAVTEFDFRDKHFRLERRNGLFHYKRMYSDSANHAIVEGITNDSTYRMVDGQIQLLTAKQKSSIQTSVNSVAYFSLLPLQLLDPAVKLNYLGEVKIDHRSHHKILITFRQEGGGKDFEDEFIYWIDAENFTVSYFAYTFHTDGGGSRFRAVSNFESVDSVLFMHHINFKPADSSFSFHNIDSAFITNRLQKVSEVRLENLKVVRF